MNRENKTTCPNCGWYKSEYRALCDSCQDEFNDSIKREKENRQRLLNSDFDRFDYRSGDNNSDFCTYNGQHD